MIIHTSRLQLCQLALTDAAFILELVNTPGWLQFIGDKGIKTIPGAEVYIRSGPLQSYAQHGFGLWLVKRNQDGLPAGICGLLKRESMKDVDIGFAFLPRYTGMGYAHEAASATIAWAHKKLGLARVTGITVKGNERSIRLLEKIGLRFEQCIRLTPQGEELLLFTTSLS